MPVHRHPIAVPQAAQLAAIPLDHSVASRLEASFSFLREHGTRLGDVFYAKLFAAAPHLRPLFRGDPQAQAAKLVASLDAIVRNLKAPAQNAAMLAELGLRHAGYGARPEHYELVVSLLVESMREVLGATAPEQSLEEWRTALQLVSKQMIAAAEAPHESPHAASDADPPARVGR